VEVVFGWDLDGLTFPETATGTTASFNALVAGPSSLLGLLETRLGFRRPPVQRAVRIAQYLSQLTNIDDGKRFYSASLASDAWATADHLLAIRDELIVAGWNRQPIDKIDKVATLALAETQGTIADGFSERLAQINSTLKTNTKPVITRLRVVGSVASLPPMIRKTIALLIQTGTKLEELPSSPKSRAGDLQALQQRLIARTSKDKLSLAGDGTVCIIDADDELQAAILTASWIAQRKDCSDIVLIRGDDCSLLNQACQRNGLPSPGNTARSQFKAICQVLPLAFEMACRPIDPKKIVEFLCIQGGPIPSWIGNRLVDALGKAPGIGGKPWHDAWEKCITLQRDWILNDEPDLSTSDAEKKAEQKLDRWQDWFVKCDTAAPAHMTQPDAMAICNRVEQWAAGRVSSDENGVLYQVLAAQTKMLRQLITLAGQASIPLIQLRKMIAAVGAYGTSISKVDAAEWSLVDRPGQIWDSAPTIVWYGFAQVQWPGVRTSNWSDQEFALLKQHGISLETTIEKLRRQSHSSRMPILNATERLILVKPRTCGGQRATAHPLWDEIKSVLSETSLAAISHRASDAFAHKQIDLAQTLIQCESREPIILPGPLRTWSVSPNIIKNRLKESYSSIDKLLGCSLAWALQYSGGMWQPKAIGLPEKQMLLGTLAHAVVKEVFEERIDWTPEKAQQRAVEIVRRLVPEMAAGLLLPGASPQLREATNAIPASLFQLTKFFRDAHVTVEGCEKHLSAPLKGETILQGDIDILIRLPSGSRAVLDFKWSSAPYWHRKRISEGTALQLAIYSWLAKQTDDQRTGNGNGDHEKNLTAVAASISASNKLPPAGYFMLRNCELFFTADGIFPRHTFVRKMARDLDETWKVTLDAYERTLAELQKGSVIATGIIDDTISLDVFMNPVLVEPPCNFCQLGHFCGKRELA
jgi:ATP-dependent helicase/nuclease subunit B